MSKSSSASKTKKSKAKSPEEPEIINQEDESTVLLEEKEYQSIIERLAASQKIQGTCMLKQYYDSKLKEISEKEQMLIKKTKSVGSKEKGKSQIEAKISEDMKRLRISLYQEVYKSLLEIHLHSLEIDKKRRNLRPQKRKVLIEWLDSHSGAPYPNEEDKERLAEESGLSTKQVSCWFANQRRKLKTDLKSKGKPTPSKPTKTPRPSVKGRN